MLRVQGSSKVFLALGQSARVFQVLPKAAEVPSITPLAVLKSSVCTSLKFPQRPKREQMGCESLLPNETCWWRRWLVSHHLPQVCPLCDGSKSIKTCMRGKSWTCIWRPKAVCMMMKKDDGLKMVTLARGVRTEELDCVDEQWHNCSLYRGILPLFSIRSQLLKNWGKSDPCRIAAV